MSKDANVATIVTAQPIPAVVQPAPELSKSEKFLRSLFAKASEKGYTPTQLVNQCVKIDQLEKKYSKTFDELKVDFDQLGKDISASTKKLKELEDKISETQKKKSDVIREYSVEEKRVRGYVDARAELLAIGFPVDDLAKVKTSLFSMKNENYDPQSIIEKLNSIQDLEARKSSLEAELSAANGDLREKKALVVQLRQMQQAGLSISQIERIRDIVTKISARRGINPDQAVGNFENDVLKNYDLALGLEGEVMRLQETKSSLAAEFEERKKSYDSKEKSTLEKIQELESKYESSREEINAYSELRAMGVNEKRILAWHQIISDKGLDWGALESELRKLGSLISFEEEASRRLAGLQDQERVLAASVSGLKEQKDILESSISSIKDQTLSELENSRSAILSSVSQMAEEMKKSSDLTKNDFNATLSDLKNAAASFSGDLNDVIKKAQEETKKQSELLETAEKIGKYEALLPLLKLNEDGNVSETEALVAMWNLTNIFIQWYEKKPTHVETATLMKRMLSSLNMEIQTVGA